MLRGFNTNIRHRGVLFHVQTEDSGLANPHVITHLFHGGNILASEKRDYAEQLESGSLEAEIKALMEAQHKAMLKRLRSGVHDAVIEQRMGPSFLKAEAELEAEAGQEESLFDRVDAQGSPEDTTSDDVTGPHDAASEAAAPAAAAETPKERIARAFGEGVVSQKPLDEVVLEYLVESARKRKRSSK